MKIFHGIIEIAGQMGILSGELKRRSHLAVGYNMFQSYLGYEEHLINTDWYEIQRMSQHLINFFDLFHFHYASSLLEDFKDLEQIKHKGKKMVMHHWGNDVRFHEQAKIRNPYVYTGDSQPNEVMHDKLIKISPFIEEAIVQDYEVYDYVQPYYKKVHVVPISIDLSKFHPVIPAMDNNKPLIVHAPTNPAFKGTEAIERAIGQLQSSYSFEYRRIENMSHEQARLLYQNADIIIDQILCGSHGLLSVEAMALGKPVITYIRDDLVSKFPAELPIINANPDNIATKIQLLLDHPELRMNAGMQGRAYVEKYHAKHVVVDRLEEIYKNL